MLSRGQIAVVHVAKKQLGLSEDEYRAILKAAGVASSKQLNQKQFTDVMNYFAGLGFVSKRRPGARGRVDRTSLKSRDRLIAKIGAQLADMGLRWSYADGIAKKMFGVDVVEFCKPHQLHKIVAALTYHQQRTAEGRGR